MADEKRPIGAVASRIDTTWSLLERTGILPLLVGGASYFLAKFTDAFQALAPWSWFMSALVAALIVQGIITLRAVAATKRSVAVRVSRLQEPKSQINPLDDVFKHKRIFVTDLIPPDSSVISGKTFISCEIVGPGTIFFKGQNNVGGDMVGCDFVRLRPEGHIYNLLAFEDCNFRDCKFIHLTILAHDELLNSKGMKGDFNVISG